MSFESDAVRRVLQISLAVTVVVNVALAGALVFGTETSAGTDQASESETAQSETESNSSDVSRHTLSDSPLPPLIDAAWIPDAYCVDSIGTEELAVLRDIGSDSSSTDEVECNFQDPFGVTVGVRVYPTTGAVETAYAELVAAAGVTGSTGGECPPAADIPVVETTFMQDGIVAGRILCVRSPSGGVSSFRPQTTPPPPARIAWYETDGLYLGIVEAADLATAFSWWTTHKFGNDWDPATERSPLDVSWLPDSCVDSETLDSIEVQLLPFRGEDADRFCVLRFCARPACYQSVISGPRCNTV